MAGTSSLFPDFPKQMSVLDRVHVIIQRHKNNYFKNWSSQELDDANICHITRPLKEISDNIYKEQNKKNEVTRNKKLQFCIETAESDNAPLWATEFHNQITNGQLKSTTKVKDAATLLWRQHSTNYDSSRAVQVQSTEPGHTVRRKRKSSETEYQYRKRRAVTVTSDDETHTDDDDSAAVTAMSIHRSLRFAMSLGKKELLEKIKENEDLVQLLKEHGPLKTKTIEDN